MVYSNVERIRKGLDRLETELAFADGLLSVFPDPACSAEVKAVRSLVAERCESLSAESVDGFVSECEGLLTKTAPLAKAVTVHFVSHAHIDMNWMWSLDETAAVTQDTLSTMLRLMERYPDFTFSQSQASVYRIVERYNPTMLDEIKRRVAEGRWEVSSCTWVEGDKNMASGESQVRQILYAKRYFKDLFGLDYDDVQLDFEPDTFGHSANTPAILSRLGVKYYYHCRGFDGPKLYRWQAQDGSSIVCYLDRTDWYIYDISPQTVVESVIRELRDTGLKDVLRVYGVGDHGGGPTVRDIEAMKQMSEWPVFPTLRFSTYARYFKEVEASRIELPLETGEHNFIFTGCYSSQSRIKAANRHGERSLGEAEAFCGIANLLSPGFDYPSGNLQSGWENLLFSQFHDILPGSGVRETREYCMAKHQETIAACSSAKKQALTAISDAINTADLPKSVGISDRGCDDRALGAGAGFRQGHNGISAPSVDDSSYRIFTVFNPSPFERSEIVEAVIWDMENDRDIVVKDSDGNITAHQMIESSGQYWGHTYRTVLFKAKDIPAMGYKTFIVHPTKEKEKLPQPADLRLEKALDAVLENEYLKVEIDTSSGALKSLVIKEGDIELVPQGRATALFRVIDEALVNRNYMSAWYTGSHANIEPVTGVKFIDTPPGRSGGGLEKSTLRSIRGAIRNGMLWSANVRGSKLVVGIYLDKGSSALRLDCKCVWLETGSPDTYIPQLNITFPIAVENSTWTFEVPYGALSRGHTDMDMPALRWADVSGNVLGDDRKAGITVATDSKYGFRSGEGCLSVTLLRSTGDPDPYPELGEHQFSIALQPHNGECNAARSYREAIAFDQPLVVFQTGAHPGRLPLEGSFVTISDPNVVLSALKKQEDGEGLVLRVYEVAGKDTDAEMHFSRELFKGEVKVTEADALERKTGEPVPSVDGVVRYRISAGQILTLVVEPADQ